MYFSLHNSFNILYRYFSQHNILFLAIFSRNLDECLPWWKLLNPHKIGSHHLYCSYWPYSCWQSNCHMIDFPAFLELVTILSFLCRSAPELVDWLSELNDAHTELECKINPLLSKVLSFSRVLFFYLPVVFTISLQIHAKRLTCIIILY